MALNLASLAGAAEPEFLNAFHHAAPVAVRGLVAPRQSNDSTVPIVNMFVDGVSSENEYAASIIDVCAGATTFALRCTAGPVSLNAGSCADDAEEIILTANPTLYRVSTATVVRTMGQDVSATIQETCRIAGTTEAACTATVGGNVGKTSTSSSSTTTYRGTDVYMFDVAITGGAEKTANPTACAAPAGSGAQGLRAGVWGVLGAAGLVGLVL
ncbi:hypothetical protein QBC39DRAFT_264588 [Podospora conica]|nr:hypothetical protein QBC39DRAFT_264588 [Schizothecium conicum]